jgi:hypothetical protein
VRKVADQKVAGLRMPQDQTEPMRHNISKILVVLLLLLTFPAGASARTGTRFGIEATRRGSCRPGYLFWQERSGRREKLHCLAQPPPYRGPWDAVHKPPTIYNGGVSVTIVHDANGDDHLAVSISREVWCPYTSRPITVTFSYQSGWAARFLRATVTCHRATWIIFRSGRRGEALPQDRQPWSDVPFGFRRVPDRPREPLVVEVSGRAGVIAERTFTVVEHFVPWQNGVDYTITDLAKCRRDHLTVYAENGELLCKKHVGGRESVPTYSIEEGGWEGH